MNAFLCRKALMGQTVRNALLLVLTQRREALCEELSLRDIETCFSKFNIWDLPSELSTFLCHLFEVLMS